MVSTHNAGIPTQKPSLTLLTAQHRRKHTVYGMGAALIVCCLLLLLLGLLDITPYVRRQEQRTIPIELLQLGYGSQTGSAGNLATEGSATTAKPSQEPLADARLSRKANHNKQTPVQPRSVSTLQRREAEAVREYTNTALPRPLKEVITSPTSPAYTASSQTKPTKTEQQQTTKSEETGSVKGKLLADAGRSIGVHDGADGSGLGRFGAGSGRGTGYGLEWGGGGNRVVLYKELPKYPAGVNTSVQIKIRFSVLPNGSVGIAMPMQKGEPALERAALEALRRWQFNPTNDGKEMIGFITFTFRVQ